MKHFNPITFELIKNGMGVLCEEMALTMARAAYSPIVREMLDFTTALLTPDGEVMSQAKAAPAKPWRASDRAFYRVVFPQMANWLPSGERQQLCFEFDTELARLVFSAAKSRRSSRERASRAGTWSHGPRGSLPAGSTFTN